MQSYSETVDHALSLSVYPHTASLPASLSVGQSVGVTAPEEPSFVSFTRTEIFGRHDLNLDAIATSPKQVIALAVHIHSCALACVPSSTTLTTKRQQQQQDTCRFYLLTAAAGHFLHRQTERERDTEGR